MKIYRFGNCYLNLTERRLLKNGKYLELKTKAFDVLRMLVEKGGEVVTKDEILGEVWSGSFVEEGNLAVYIWRLRRLLDSSKTEPFIETVQGSGYRFVTSVKAVSDDEWQKHLPVDRQPHRDKNSADSVFDSIAVLPLENEGRDVEIDYLADGLTESFINSLSRISDLKVIARNTVFRYKNKETEAVEIGETLGVDAVLTGRIRVIKDNLMISVELIKVADGTQIWGTKINQPFSDIIEVQEKIIVVVAETLRSEISNVAKRSLNNNITNNAESYRLYLKGKYLLEKWNEEDFYKAIECFDKSVSFDPMNVYSYVEMIESYFLLYFSDYISFITVKNKIKPILSIVSELNQSVDVVQAMLGGKKMYLEWKFVEAEKHFQQALTINTNCLIARYRYSNLMMLSGKFSDALKEVQQITMIDPLSLLNYKRISRIFYKMERFENAITYLKDVIEMDPTDYVALALMGSVLTELGNYEEALAFFQKSLDSHYNLEVLSMVGCVNARIGRKDQAFQIVKQIESQSKDNCQHSIKLARIYLDLGEKEIAYNFLDEAFNEHDVDLISLRSDPRWSSISHEQRFKELVLKVGLPISQLNSI